MVRKKKLCIQFLKSHQNRCFSKIECGVGNCRAKHHALLHDNNIVEMRMSPSNESESPNSSTSAVVHSHEVFDVASPSIFRIIPIQVLANDKVVNTFAFSDEGSSVTLMGRQVLYASNGLVELLVRKKILSNHQSECVVVTIIENLY